MVNKFLKLFLLLIPLLAAAYYTLMWAFGCGFGGEAFVCHTLLSVSIYLLIGCAVSFIVLCITYFTDNKQIGTLFLKLYIVLFVLFLLALIFAQNFKQIPEYVRMQNFNNQNYDTQDLADK